MEQGSNAWNDWRDEGLGSSDAPVIVQAKGCYTTRHKLFLAKTGKAKPLTEKEKKSKEFIFDKGHRIEEMVRARYEKRDLVSYKAALFQRADHSWAKASVDLCDHENKKIKEVKYVSLEEFEAGVVPERYFPQVQWQYICTDETWTVDVVLATDYMWNEDGTEKIKIPKNESFRTKEIPCPLDLKYCGTLFQEMHDFWNNHILKNSPPELSDKDAVPLKDKELLKLIKKYAANQKKINKVSALEKENKKLLDEIFKHETVKHPIMSAGKIRLTLTAKKGSVDIKLIPEVAEALKKYTEADLEKFRAAGSVSRSIKC